MSKSAAIPLSFNSRIFSVLTGFLVAGSFGNVLAAPPANDNFSNAAVLSGAFDTHAGTSEDATREAGEPVTGDESVWFRWRAPESGRARFSASPDDIDGTRVLKVWCGSTLGNLRLVALNEQRVSDLTIHKVPVVKDKLYYFSLGTKGVFDEGDSYNFSVVLDQQTAINSLSNLQAEERNDTFAQATAIPEEGGSVISYTYDATGREAGEPQRNRFHSSWVKWVAPHSGRASVSMAGSDDVDDNGSHTYFGFNVNKTLVVYAADTFPEMANADPVVISDVRSGNITPVSFSTIEGQTYYISVGVATNDGPGNFAWRILSLAFRREQPGIRILSPRSQTGKVLRGVARLTGADRITRVKWSVPGKSYNDSTGGRKLVSTSKKFRGRGGKLRKPRRIKVIAIATGPGGVRKVARKSTRAKYRRYR